MRSQESERQITHRLFPKGEQWQEEKAASQQVILLLLGHPVTVRTDL